MSLLVNCYYVLMITPNSSKGRVVPCPYQTPNSLDPDFLLFAQHGWADNNKSLSKLTQELINNNALLIAPSLGIIKTFVRILPLVKEVERIASQTISQYPETPIRILGHSMGGLIWLEVLHRNPQWWQKVHSFVLMGSPIGGSDVARTIDPLGIGIGIAGDLGKNRRHLAEKIARNIPTLTIASNLDSGSDGLVTLETTKFSYCQFVCVQGIAHSALRYHPRVVPIIQNFWVNPTLGVPPESNLATQLIDCLRSVSGITDGHWRNFTRSQVYINLPEGITIRTWKNPLGVDHVFVADKEEQCLYAGYVGWLHSPALRQTLAEIKQENFKQENFC